MATEGLFQVRQAMDAAADLSDKRYYLAKITSTGLALAEAGEHGYSLVEEGAAGASCTIVLSGKAKAIVGDDTITPGMKLAADANGAVVEATGAAFVSGIALEGGVQNQIIQFFPVTAQLNTTT